MHIACAGVCVFFVFIFMRLLQTANSGLMDNFIFFSLCLVFYFVGGSHFVVVRKQKETATFFVLLFHTGSSIKFGRSSENDSKLLFVDLSAFQQQQQQFYRTTIFKACSFRMAVSPMNRFMFITPAKV